MSDLIYVGVVVAFFAANAFYVRCCAKLWEDAMETVIVGGIALALFIYLFVAMLRPEKF